MGVSKYQEDGDPRTSGPGFGVAVHENSLRIPHTWRKPRLVFVNSMSDLFHARIPTSFIRAVFDVMASTPQHTYQVLTKRSRRMLRIAPQLPWTKNIWMGVSVESADQYDRVRDLTKVRAAVRFLSCEPLLGPLPMVPLHGVDWVIAGGESGPNARPIEPEWLRNLRNECERSTVPFFFKQWGGVRAKSGGRVLDGRVWNDMPNPNAEDSRTLAAVYP